MRKVIFLAGVYGVGKTSVCKYIEERLNIPCYSSSQLISSKNRENYGANKFVSDSENNQKILIEEVNKIKDSIFVLDGHFCLLDTNNTIISINKSVFKTMNITEVIFLYADENVIFQNIVKRDKKEYDFKLIRHLFNEEERQANKVAKDYNIPLYKVEMYYNKSDVLRVIHIVNKIKRGEH